MRHKEQRYVFVNFEPIASSTDEPIFAKSQPHFFNWTMTVLLSAIFQSFCKIYNENVLRQYKRNSDILNTFPHGAVRLIETSVDHFPLKLPTDVHLPNPRDFMGLARKKPPILMKKAKMVMWFNSQCQTNSLREKFIDELSRYAPVKIYSNCENQTCLPWNSIECFDMLDNYKFYLSAENFFCPDYLTEELYRALNRNVDPIVYGGADYSAFAPPHSVIHAGDFASPKDLADYLLMLDKNDALYMRYFEWKKNYEVIFDPANGWCDLCEMLNDPLQPVKTYKNLTEWWFNVACLSDVTISFNKTI